MRHLSDKFLCFLRSHTNQLADLILQFLNILNLPIALAQKFIQSIKWPFFPATFDPRFERLIEMVEIDRKLFIATDYLF